MFDKYTAFEPQWDEFWNFGDAHGVFDVDTTCASSFFSFNLNQTALQSQAGGGNNELYFYDYLKVLQK